MQPSRAVRLFGTEEPSAPVRRLAAGPLTAELEAGALRNIRWHGVEAIRGIAYLLRDKDWATPPPTIEALTIEEPPGAFLVRYRARIEAREIGFVYTAEIEASAEGRLRFDVVGEPLTAFLTNRTGFVVLHPVLGVAGQPVSVEHTDGRVEPATFPEVVSPGQPIFDIRALTHAPTPGIEVVCRMTAELPHDPLGKFEMEDHRNWSDASYKTYVGSLLDPWPYRLEPGQRLTQGVALTCRGQATAAVAGAAPKLKLAAAGGDLPVFGLGLDPATIGAALKEAPLLARLGLRRLTAWLDLDDPAATRQLDDTRALLEALQAELQLELVLPCRQPVERELDQAAMLCRRAGLAPAAVIPCPAAYLKSFQPSGPWPDLPPLAAIYNATRSAFPKARVGGGMLSYFTELNRQRPPATGIDFVSHTTAPIVHAADDRSVMETLEALPSMARSIAAICPNVPYRIGPSAIGMRHNPYGATTVANPAQMRLAMAEADPRQRGLFAAAWTIGYAKALAPFGLEALVLNHATGPSGVIAGPIGVERPWFETNPAATVYPVFHVMAALGRALGRPRLSIETGDPALAGIGWADGDGRHGLLANLGPTPRRATLEAAAIHLLDDSTFTQACQDPAWLDGPPSLARALELELDAYACALLRWPA